MVRRSNYAALKDAQTKSSVEECASNMGQRRSNAAAKGALAMLSEEEYVEGTGHNAIRKMSLLRLDQNSRGQPQLKCYLISVLLELPKEKGRKEVEFQER